MVTCKNCGAIKPKIVKVTATAGEPTKWVCPTCEAENFYESNGEATVKQQTVHPLLNPDSPHYKMVDDVEAIERMEQMYSTEDLMAWAKVTAMKYRLRIGKKDEVSKEVKKILSFEAYYTYLKEKL